MIEELQPPKLILAHMGGWKQWEQVEEILCGAQVYLDCAFCSDYMLPEQFERLVQKHGADKILFATDSPWENPKDTIAWVEKTSLTIFSELFLKNKKKALHFMQGFCIIKML